MGWDSSVGIATGYRLDGPGTETRWGRDFPYLSTWSPPSLLYNVYRVFPEGKERPGRDADPSPPSSAVGHERVELYLYSFYGPYGLYRASVPVQGCTLPFSFTYRMYKLLILNVLDDNILICFIWGWPLDLWNILGMYYCFHSVDAYNLLMLQSLSFLHACCYIHFSLPTHALIN